MSMNLKRVLRALLVVMAVAGAGAPPAAAQDGSLAARCADLPPGDPTTVCLAVSQAVESAQPQLGLLIAGGNPVLGSVGRGGLRLPGLPSLDLTARANLVFVRIPDILAPDVGGAAQRVTDRLGVAAPALTGGAAVGIFQGGDLIPGFGGLGSVDLLVSGAWLPFRAFAVDGFDEESPDIAWGVGARIGVLRESFVAPGVSVSVMRHSLGRVAFGEVCRGDEVGLPMTDERECIGLSGGTVDPGGDAGEFQFDLINWSTRAVVGKRLLGLGLAGGIGYDRYSSDVEYAFRYTRPVTPRSDVIVRPTAVDLSSTRWSAFGNVSYRLLLTSLSLEAGWQQGDRPVPGFGGEARFDPRGGSWFGGAGVRLSF
jgi:hypothetical protein